jgi:acyl carrier protein
MLDCNSIGLDDDFFEKGGDSLRAVQMLLELEKIVGHSVPESMLVVHSTIRQLARAVAELDLSTATPLIQVQPKGGRPPFFFFHGDYNGGYYTRRLARLLGPDQPFIAVVPHELGAEPIPRSIEQMAAERLLPILAAHAHGPFRLGGYCNAAVVALEVARLLVRAGHRVELVVLIDSPTLVLRPTARILFQSIAKGLNIVDEDWEQGYPRLAFAMDVLWRQLSNLEIYWRNSRCSLQRGLSELFGNADAPADRWDVKSRVAQIPEERARRERQLARIYNRLFRNYFPEEIEVPVIYFSAEYGVGPLRNLGPRVEAISLPGGHWGCITTHVEVLAGHLRRRLEGLTQLGLSEVPRQSGDAGGAELQRASIPADT